MKLALILLAFLAALVAVHGAATTTVVGATETTTAVGSTVPAVVKAGIPISVGNLSTVSSTSTTTVQGATTGVTVSSTGATGGFVGQPTIVGATGATVSIATAVATPAASAAASSAAIASASPAASGAAVITIVSASPAAITSASPAASGAAVITIVSASPAASGAAITSASPAASGAAVVTVVSPSPSISGAASPAASLAASPTASAAASRAASPTASLAASPGASASAAPLASASPAAPVSAANLFPPMPTYGEENFQFTCPNGTTQGMVEVSLDPLLIGIGDVSSIKFAGCPSLMYVSTRAGQVFEVTINNQTSAVEQVRLILDLSSQIPTSSSQGTAGSSAAGASASASASSSSASSSSSRNAADQPGLLGMAFPPNFADTGLFYLYFSARSSGGASGAASATTTGGASASIAGASAASSSSSSICGNESTKLDHVNRLAEYRLNSSSGIATFSRTLLELRWPFANDNGDNSLEFAPETMLLFLGVGDGGSSFDPFENAQNPDVMLGKVQVINLNALPANASCNATVLRLSELERECREVASAITTFATGMHAPAGFEFLSPSAELEGAACPSGANATLNATATAGGANATAAGGANATSANATTSAGGRNLTLSDLAPRLIAPDRGQGMYDEVNIMEQIGANYGWDIIEGWTCVNQSLELCPESTSGRANVSAAGGANATSAGRASATASTNATTAGGANATAAGGANATASANATAGAANATSGIAVLPAAVLPHNCRRLYNPQAILGGRLYRGTQLDPLLQGAYVFGATTSLQNGNESLPTGNGALYFLRPESFSGNAEVDLTMCPAAANATVAGGANASANATASTNATTAGGANATATASNATSSANASLSGITVTGSGVNTSFIPNSRLEVFPVTINYQFFPTQHFFTAVGADASRTQLFLGVSSAQSGSGNIGGVFRLIPFNEGAQNPAVISATNLRPGQIVFSANATANATASASPSMSA